MGELVSAINCSRSSIAAKIALSWAWRRLRNSLKGSELSSIGRTSQCSATGQRGRNGGLRVRTLISNTATTGTWHNPERLPDRDCGEHHGTDDRHGFQTPLSLIEPGQSLRNRVDLVVVTPMRERKELSH